MRLDSYDGSPSPRRTARPYRISLMTAGTWRHWMRRRMTSGSSSGDITYHSTLRCEHPADARSASGVTEMGRQGKLVVVFVEMDAPKVLDMVFSSTHRAVKEWAEKQPLHCRPPGIAVKPDREGRWLQSFH